MFKAIGYGALMQFKELINKHTLGIRLYKRHHLHENLRSRNTLIERYLSSDEFMMNDWGDGFMTYDYDDYNDYDVWDDQND